MNPKPVQLTQRQVNAMAVLVLIGAIVGSTVGMAALGAAMAGTVPLALLGLWLGYEFF